MSTNTTQSKPDKKHETSSCCGGKAETTEKPHQHDKPQDTKPQEKSSCCSK